MHEDNRYILVLDRGFVLVGVVRNDPSDPTRVFVDKCSCVRRWGTTAGLGQLAREGIQPDTVLDPEGDGVSVYRKIIHRAIPCNADAWRD